LIDRLTWIPLYFRGTEPAPKGGMLFAISLLFFAGGFLSRLMQEVQRAPEGYEEEGGLSILEESAG
jgi:hypothetical protein